MSSIQTSAAKLYHELYLEIQEIEAGLRYEAATSFCDNCPAKDWDDWTPQSYSDMEFGPSIADHCCKTDDDYQQDSIEHIDFCRSLMEQLKTLAGDEEIAAAQTKVSQH